MILYRLTSLGAMPTMIWILLFALVVAALEPKDRIIFEPAQIPWAQIPNYLTSNEGYEVMKLQNLSYLCKVPTTHIQLSRPPPLTPESKNQSLNLIKENLDNGDCVFAFNIQGAYWTVGFCFGDKVIQFHEDIKDFKSGNHRPQLPNHIYVLGKFPNTAPYKKVRPKNQLGITKAVEVDPDDFTVVDGEFSYFEDNQRFIKHTLYGDICDLTLLPRTIDVVYKCAEQYKIIDFQETKTCEYQIVIGVPKLCELEEFRKVEENVLDIKCKLIEGSQEKLDLSKYTLKPMNKGVYWGARSGYPNIAVTLEPLDLIQFGKFVVSSLEKIPGPEYSPKTGHLKWSDSFTYLVEQYDLFGNFHGLFEIINDASDPKHEILIEQIEPRPFHTNLEDFFRAKQ